MNYCRVCLVTNVKLFSLQSISLKFSVIDAYSQLMQIPFTADHYVCFECMRLLHKYLEFKTKCHRANNILSKLKSTYCIINQQILNVERKNNNLCSNLTITPVNTYDYIKLDLNTNEIKLENGPESETVKDETESEINGDNNDFTDMAIILHDNDSESKDVEHFEMYSESDDEPLSKKVKETSYNKESHKLKDKLKNFFEGYGVVVSLTLEDAKMEMLKRKESSNYKNALFKCELCFRGYEMKAAFNNHMKKHSVENGKHICDLCHLRFPEKRYLCKHKLACHKRKFSCRMCNYVCFCIHQAKTHVSLHKGQTYPCKECGEIFSMPNSLHMHKRNKHQNECVCEFCGSTFVTLKGLSSHKIKIHRHDKNPRLGPRCVECDVHFATEEAWKLHLVLSPKHKVSNGCKNCGETFANNQDLKQHLKIHTRKHPNLPKLPATCTICNTSLSTRKEYNEHMTSEHPSSNEAKKINADNRAFICEVCGESFKKQCFLTYHQRRHTGERPHACDVCGARFVAPGGRTAHRRLHARAALRCRLCARAFRYKSALNKHMKIHLGIRPHKCPICDKGFINRCDVRLHVRCVHDKVPWPKRNRSKPKNAEETTFLD